MPDYYRDKKNEGVIILWWEGERRARHATPDLSYYWEREHERSARIMNGMERKKERKSTSWN